MVGIDFSEDRRRMQELAMAQKLKEQDKSGALLRLDKALREYRMDHGQEIARHLQIAVDLAAELVEAREALSEVDDVSVSQNTLLKAKVSALEAENGSLIRQRDAWQDASRAAVAQQAEAEAQLEAVKKVLAMQYWDTTKQVADLREALDIKTEVADS